MVGDNQQNRPFAEGDINNGDSATFEFFATRITGDAAKISPESIEELDEKVPKKLDERNLQSLRESVEWIGEMIERVKLLFRMIRDKEYSVDFKTKALIAAGLAYFVLPTDLIPDFIPGIGYLDDALVLSTLWRLVSDEVDRYVSFVRSAASSSPAEECAIDGQDAPLTDPA